MAVREGELFPSLKCLASIVMADAPGKSLSAMRLSHQSHERANSYHLNRCKSLF